MNILDILNNYLLFKNNYINKEKIIEYWVDDPLLNLKDKTNHFDPILPFKVNGYEGGGHKQESYKGRAANCYAVMNCCLKNIQEKKLLPLNWFNNKTLNIYPLSGMDLNAYYDRSNIKFFYYFDYTIRKNIYLCESSDVVTHELGHAILDAIRPDFWDIQSYEIWALHESFGDIIAILNILENKKIIKLMLKETNGDLSKSNRVTKLAEQFAKTIYNVTNGKYGMSPDFLRDAVNSFVYVDPIKLKDDDNYDKLSRECHSFSRVWTGCFYDIFVEIYKVEKESNSKEKAIEKSKNICGFYFIKAIEEVPCTLKIFDALAQKIIQIDNRDNKGKYNQILRNIFQKRNILNTNINISIQNFKINESKTKKIKITQGINKKLINCFVEVPFENKYELSNTGEITLLCTNDEQELKENAISCLNTLNNTNMLSKLFEIKNKNLLRQKIIN